MRISRNLFILSSCLALITNLTSPFAVFAQDTPPSNFDFTVSPVFFDFNAKPSSVINDKVRLRNNTTEPLELAVKIKKMGGDEQGELSIQDVAEDESLSWIEIKEASVKTLPKEWATIPFSLTVPDNAAYGYYWAISFTSPDDKLLDATGTKVTASLVVPILLNVDKAGAKTEGKILSFGKDRGWYEYLPVNFKTIFENRGNVHIRPRGNIFIKNWRGKQIAAIEVNSGQSAILPNTKKTFDTAWNDSFITRVAKLDESGKPILDNKGKAKTELKFRFDKVLDLRIGKYTATNLMVISSDERDIALENTVSFFVFPWKIVIGGIVFALFAILGVLSTVKSIGRRIIKLFRKGKKHE